MITSKDTIKKAFQVAAKKRVYIEGNFYKLLDSKDPDIKDYIEECKLKDGANRKKRLSITKQIQKQNKELEEAAVINKALLIDLKNKMEELKDSKKEAETLRDEALNDLEVMQKRTQFELISIIVKLALGVIAGVGILTTVLYIYILSQNLDSKIIETTWSNLFGILLTNSFSIVGTIMGVKYAADKN